MNEHPDPVQAVKVDKAGNYVTVADVVAALKGMVEGCEQDGYACSEARRVLEQFSIQRIVDSMVTEAEYAHLAKRCNQLEHLVGEISRLLRRDMTDAH